MAGKVLRCDDDDKDFDFMMPLYEKKNLYEDSCFLIITKIDNLSVLLKIWLNTFFVECSITTLGWKVYKKMFAISLNHHHH